MTQQPYYPQQPVQGYAPAQPAAYPPQQFQQPYAQPAPQYAPQAPVQAAPPQAPLADGSLDAFYNQPNLGGGPGISWKGKPDGYTVQGFVPRDVTNADVTQEVGAPGSPDAGRPKFYRDGRPMFVMSVPLHVGQSAEFPEGEARLYVRGQLRDELGRAMQEAGAEGAPKAGATITVQLVTRKQGRGTIPQNIFAVTYTPPGQPAPQMPHQGNQQPYPQQPQAQAPVQQYAPQAQSIQQPVQQQAAYAAAPGAPSPAPGAVAPQQAHPQQVASQPAPPAPAAPQPPAGLTPEQQAILAQVAGQPQQG